MTRNLTIFIGTFLAGALLALVARAALFDPHADQPVAEAAPEYAPMVSNPLTPVAAAETAPPPPEATAPTTTDPHAGHGSSAAPADGQPVNTICAICGMEVDPALPTAEYQGQTIGFGCRMCPPKFKANPDKYGPAYLRNEVYKP